MTRLTDIIALCLGAAALIVYIVMWVVGEKGGYAGTKSAERAERADAILSLVLGALITATLVTNIVGVVMDKK